MLIKVQENIQTIQHIIFSNDRFGTPKYKERIGSSAIFMVYEEYTIANGNYMTVSIVLEELDFGCYIHFVQGGSSRGLFGFDWGSGRRREQRLIRVLDENNIQYEIVKE